MKQLVLDLIPSPLPTFANFIPGRNQEVLAALRTAPQSGSTVLYLWGGNAAGKTHLLTALQLKMPERPISTRLLPALASELPSELPAADLLLMDDVHLLDEAAQIKLFNLVNLLNAPGNTGTLIATGNVSPRDLLLRRDLSTRLASGLVYQLHPLDDDEKLNALRSHASERGFELREDVAAYLLRHARRDMRSLMSVLDALDQYSLETSRPITLPLLREAIQPGLL